MRHAGRGSERQQVCAAFPGVRLVRKAIVTHGFCLTGQCDV